MKYILRIITSTCLIAFLLSCEKSELKSSRISETDSSVSSLDLPINNSREGVTFYYPETCPLQNGEFGSRCANSSEDACWEATACKKNPRRALELTSDLGGVEFISNEQGQITNSSLLGILKDSGTLPLK